MQRFPPVKVTPKRFPSSPKTPVKRYGTKPNDLCFVCGANILLSGVKAYFNVKSCQPGLARVLRQSPSPTESNRVCRSCKRKIDSIISKESVIDSLVEELRKKHEGCKTQSIEKRLAVDSPGSGNHSSKRLKKSTTTYNLDSPKRYSIERLESSSKACEDDDVVQISKKSARASLLFETREGQSDSEEVKASLLLVLLKQFKLNCYRIYACFCLIKQL